MVECLKLYQTGPKSIFFFYKLVSELGYDVEEIDKEIAEDPKRTSWFNLSFDLALLFIDFVSVKGNCIYKS